MCPDSIFPFASQTMFPKKTDETTGHLRLRLFGIWPTKGLGSNYAICLQGYNSCWGPELPKQHTGKAALHVHENTHIRACNWSCSLAQETPTPLPVRQTAANSFWSAQFEGSGS